jgi:hypothetical protein
MLETHDDMPPEIQEQLYAEEQQWYERQAKIKRHPGDSSCLPININFLSAQSPQVPVLPTPAITPLLLPHSGPDMVDALFIPDLPLDTAAKEYSRWQQSRIDSETLKDDIGKAHNMALTNGPDLKQVQEDRDPEFFIKHGVKLGVARRFVNDIRSWVEQR